MNTKIKATAAAALLLLGASACGDDESSGAGAAKVTIEKAWARTSPMMAEAGAAYMNLTAAADDALVKASVEATVAKTVEIHETVMATEGTGMATEGTAMTGTTAMTEGTGMSGSTAMPGTGAMMMRPVAKIALAKGSMVELKPGGYHVMLLGLVKPLKVGDTLKMTLTFEKAGTITVDVPVREDAP